MTQNFSDSLATNFQQNWLSPLSAVQKVEVIMK